MNNLEILKFENYINKIVKEAFYNIYSKSDSNWFNVESINISHLEGDEFELPLVNVEISFGTSFKERFQCESYIHLDKSFDFNVGYLTNVFEKADDSIWGE